jgi:hypothetical protein
MKKKLFYDGKSLEQLLVVIFIIIKNQLKISNIIKNQLHICGKIIIKDPLESHRRMKKKLFYDGKSLEQLLFFCRCCALYGKHHHYTLLTNGNWSINVEKEG